MSNYSQTQLTSLFLQTSLEDCKKDYHRSLSNERFSHWDCIVLTASNDTQAKEYERQIEYRKGRLPKNTDFMVVPDKDNKRVGSGGSTLSVIKELKKKYRDFKDKKFLVIHAGGNSSRCPQYSAIGKLFAPLPTSIDGISASLFDMFLITMASIPSRMKEGMLLLSGDVTLLFNPLMCDFGNSKAAVISFKEDVRTGKDHGVYVKDNETGNVKKFLHKQSIEVLRENGAVDERNMCSIDTGALWLSREVLEKLYCLVDNENKYNEVVNEKVRLSLYGDIAYCLAEDSSYEKFLLETPEGEFCEELSKVRKNLWDLIGEYDMKLMNLAPAKFIHFGSIPEIMHLMNQGVLEYENIGWCKQVNSYTGNHDVACYDSILSDGARIGKNSYFELSFVGDNARIGEDCYISYMDIENTCIPDHVLVHGLKQNNGKFICRMMDIDDNPKSHFLFGVDLNTISKLLGVELGDSLWNGELYPEMDSMKEALDASLNLYDLIKNNKGDLYKWKNSKKKSLCSGFNESDGSAILDWNRKMQELVELYRLSSDIHHKRPCIELGISKKRLSKNQIDWVNREISKLDINQLDDFSYAIRLYYYLGSIYQEESYIGKCFDLIAKTVLDSTLKNLKYNEKAKIVQEETIVKLPLRVNWGGGWSDTCPHCLENGGTVLNAAITFNGQYPVQVRLVKINELKIVFDSRDMDVHGEFEEIEPLQMVGDPSDPFALQKSCLLACGILPKTGGNLKEILNRLGGGFEMHSEVINVPKGSGLGTSSILSAAAVKAMFQFMGIEYNDDILYATVLAMEQIMSTGGGWQDQVGGVTPGIKLITSKKGIEQHIKVEHVSISEKTKRELNDRFAIIYTGQRRLARNLLRDVVGRYVGSVEDSIDAHQKIQEVAVLMKEALNREDVDEFARLLDYHWSLSQKVDEGSTNSLINQIFLSIDDLIDARMCCGAGGGGFLQVMLKKGVSKKEVHDRLKEIFQDFNVDIYDSEIVY